MYVFDKKIIIIDDNEELRNVTKYVLEMEGYEVLTASNGEEGIKIVKKHKPDLILCDLLMPGIDGFEVKKQLSKDASTMIIPFIFMSAVSEQHIIRKGMSFGADDYLVKPVVLDELLNTISTRLEKSIQFRQYFKDKTEGLKNSIVGILSHELLTPLTSILGFSAILKEEDSLSRFEIKKVAAAIEESGNQLYHLVNKNIKYAKNLVEGGKTKTSPNLANSAEVIINSAVLIAEKYKRHNDLVLQLNDCAVSIESFDFEFIISEIVDNAFKFSKENTPVFIKSTIVNDENIIQISDKGIGFPMDKLCDIAAFNQFDRQINEQQGIGFGLITSILIIQRYGGRINILNNNSGTEVVITFPLIQKTDSINKTTNYSHYPVGIA